MGVAMAMVRDLAQVIAGQVDAREEIRRILDTIERRGGNGGSGPDAVL